MRRDWKTIARIVEVRRAQRAAADVHAVRARAARDATEGRRDQNAETLAEHQQRWSRTLAEPSLRLDAANAWAREVQSSQVDLGRTELELLEAEAEQDRRNLERAKAMARLECSEQLEETLRRRLTRRREEAALNEIADRNSLRKPTK